MAVTYSGQGSWTSGQPVTVSNEVEVKNDSGSPVPVSVSSLPLPADAATETTLAKRFAGSKLAKTAQVTASGDTTILTPTSGQKIRVYWVSAINDPDATASPRIRIGFNGASDYLYNGYAIAHWEVFTGNTNQALVCNLDEANGAVAITVHYVEVT